MIGNIIGTLEEIKNRELRLADMGQNDGEAIQIEGLRAEVRLLFEDMPELTFFENLSLSCSDDVFFEIIANAVRNNTMAHQSTVYAIKNARKLRLTNNIKDLKERFNANSREILILERELSNMEENERKVELEHYRLFSTLNAERITPYFMSLVKNTKQAQTTNDILDNEGNAFSNSEKLSDFVGKYYKEVHKINNMRVPCDRERLEEFLGDVKNNPELIGSKLTEQERVNLESPLTVDELDNAINQCNMQSAPGADGFS
jgi:hypothetical protein